MRILTGASYVVRGFGWWRVRPGLMALGLLPALVVAALWVAAFIALIVNIDRIAEFLTGFADSWHPTLVATIRTAASLAVIAAAAGLMVTTFTALCLLIGEPIYDRIWRSVEIYATGAAPKEVSFWRSAGASARLLLLSALAAVTAFALGFVPLIGAPLAAVGGAVLQGWVLGHDLTSRAMLPRSHNTRSSNQPSKNRGETLGFGIAAYLLMLIPLAAIIVMPAAVAGSTKLVHGLTGITRAEDPPPHPHPSLEVPPAAR